MADAVPPAYRAVMDQGISEMTNQNCWIVDFFLENLPLETPYGTAMYPLINSFNDNNPIYQEDKNAAKVPAESILVFADSYGFAMNCLKYAPPGRVGHKVIVTAPPEKMDQTKAQEYLSEPWDMIIYAYGIDEPKDSSAEEILKRQADVTKCLFHLCKQIGEDKEKCGRLAVLTCDVFAEEREIHEEMGIKLICSSTLTGFCNTARVETDIPIQHIDVEWSLPETMMPILSSEVFRLSTFGMSCTRILKTGRWACRNVNPRMRYQQAAQTYTDANGGKVPLPNDGVIAISGGNGAVALVIGTWLLKQVAAQGCTGIQIKFLSRSAKISDQNLPQWNEIEALAEKYGIKVAQEKNDVSNPDDVYSFVEKYQSELIGYVHSAGVLADGMLFNLKWDSFDTVWNPKSRAAHHLHLAFEKYDAPLKFFWMFSSVAVYGSMGQLNYSSSNSYMDALARHRRALGKPCLTIQWGAWGEVGMAANLDEASKKRMLNGPMPPFSNAQGIDGLECLIKTGIAYGSVYQVNPDFMIGMVNAPALDANGMHSRNFYDSLAIPFPVQDLKPENAYSMYRSLCEHEPGRALTQHQGLVYKHYVKPNLDPLGIDEDYN